MAKKKSEKICGVSKDEYCTEVGKLHRRIVTMNHSILMPPGWRIGIFPLHWIEGPKVSRVTAVLVDDRDGKVNKCELAVAEQEASRSTSYGHARVFVDIKERVSGTMNNPIKERVYAWEGFSYMPHMDQHGKYCDEEFSQLKVTGNYEEALDFIHSNALAMDYFIGRFLDAPKVGGITTVTHEWEQKSLEEALEYVKKSLFEKGIRKYNVTFSDLGKPNPKDEKNQERKKDCRC